jgi:ankyrin repeat protein
MTDFEALIDAANTGSVEQAQAILQRHPELISHHDASGATALHYATFAGHSDVARLLVQHGADINARDTKFNATPAGWAIEYLREMGALLGIEINDTAHAIRQGDSLWAARLLKRFPGLRDAVDTDGTSLRVLAAQSGNPEIIRLFESPKDS